VALIEYSNIKKLADTFRWRGKDGDDAKPYEERNVREAIQKSQGL
jgi:hypothetical protein